MMTQYCLHEWKMSHFERIQFFVCIFTDNLAVGFRWHLNGKVPAHLEVRTAVRQRVQQMTTPRRKKTAKLGLGEEQNMFKIQFWLQLTADVAWSLGILCVVNEFCSAAVTIAAFYWALKLVFPMSYFRVGSRGAHRIPSFPLGDKTSDFNGTIFLTGKLVSGIYKFPSPM